MHGTGFTDPGSFQLIFGLLGGMARAALPSVDIRPEKTERA